MEQKQMQKKELAVQKPMQKATTVLQKKLVTKKQIIQMVRAQKSKNIARRRNLRLEMTKK